MSYDKELIIHKLERWDRFITNYHLPDWDSIPDLGLYMDQVVVLLVQYLSFIPSIPGGKESFVTSSAINNYVRLKIMPAPVKRKYYRVHIAYLIMILTMKQSISISDVQKIIPADIPEEVWAEVAQGVSLTHAYALYRAAAGAADAKARSLNRVNAERSAPLGTEGDPTDALTQEQVENMSPQAVKKNYNRILASMRNWRL